MRVCPSVRQLFSLDEQRGSGQAKKENNKRMRKFEEWGKERRDWKMKKGMRRTAAAGIAAAMILAQCRCGLGGRERTGG